MTLHIFKTLAIFLSIVFFLSSPSPSLAGKKYLKRAPSEENPTPEKRSKFTPIQDEWLSFVDALAYAKNEKRGANRFDEIISEFSKYLSDLDNDFKAKSDALSQGPTIDALKSILIFSISNILNCNNGVDVAKTFDDLWESFLEEVLPERYNQDELYTQADHVKELIASQDDYISFDELRFPTPEPRALSPNLQWANEIHNPADATEFNWAPFEQLFNEPSTPEILSWSSFQISAESEMVKVTGQ